MARGLTATVAEGLGTPKKASSEGIGEAQRGVLLQLIIAMTVTALGSVVKTGINKYVAGYILVELEGKRILPLKLGTLVGGITIETGLPTYVVGKLPQQIDRKLRTEIVQLVLAFVQTVTRGELKTVNGNCKPEEPGGWNR